MPFGMEKGQTAPFLESMRPCPCRNNDIYSLQAKYGLRFMGDNKLNESQKERTNIQILP